MFKKYMRSLGIFFLVLIDVFLANSTAVAGVKSEDVRVGYTIESFRAVNPKDAQIALELWISKLCHKKGFSYKVHAQIFDNITDLTEAINGQKLDIIGLNSYDYLMIRDKVHIEPALIATFGTDIGHKYVLLIDKELNIHELSQLKGKRILLYLGSNPLPLLWLNNLLKKQGLPAKDRFFKSCKEVDKASQAILPVFFRQADACIVTRRAFEVSAELNPQISQRLEPIKTSPLFTETMMVFRQGYNSDNKKIFIDTALNMKKYPEGKQIMTLFQIDGFALFKDSYLSNVVTLIQESGKLK